MDELAVNVCEFGSGALPAESILYKYLSVEGFLYLLGFQRLLFQSITQWPDAYEGSRYEFLRSAKNVQDLASKARNSYLGSCWTLQRDDPRLHKTNDEFAKANAELEKQGSAAMWESYCKNGGVRIATTLGKLTSLLSRSLEPGKLYHGSVCYEAEASWSQTLRNSDVVCTLFVKRIAFRHESEYRFIYIPTVSERGGLTVKFEDFFDFVDEVLIAPANENRRWVARTIYNIAASESIGPNRPGSNFKNGKKFCRISKLYGDISEELGHGSMR